MKYIILIFSFFNITFNCYAAENNLIDKLKNLHGQIETCYAELKHDTLTIGNVFVERQFKWNQGNLISITIQNKISNKSILIQNGSHPDLSIGELTGKCIDSEYSVKIIKQSPIKPMFLQVKIRTVYEDLEIRRVFRIYPASMAIACDLYLKSKIDSIQIRPNDIIVENLFLPSLHWRLEAVEFFDDTDYHNNLVKNESIFAYRNSRLKGNLLYAHPTLESTGFFILKEAPCSFVQNNYPGYDFKSDWKLNQDHIELLTSGLGIVGSELTKDEWTKCFSTVLGVHDKSEQSKRMALRSYQNNIRRVIPERDELFMVNTWGDRNKATKINEKFIMEELKRAHQLGFTHYMIDVGWHEGISMHSAPDGLHADWAPEDWMPRKKTFPNGFDSILKLAKSLDIELGLWFLPSHKNENAKWEQDADILIDLYNQYGIKYMKIDGVRIPTKKADHNLQKFFNKILESTHGEMVFIFDVTADNRLGYHYNNHIGKIFLENRYTDWRNYYPYKTLRNIWMLSSYVPLQNLHIEFLNKWRHADKYGDDALAPSQYSFDYLFAITIPSQPLAWFETTGLPKEAETSIPWFNLFNSIRADLHDSYIFPIGNEPDGTSFTGFQFMQPEGKGYILVFRELNENSRFPIRTLFDPGQRVEFKKVYGNGTDFNSIAGEDGVLYFELTEKNSFCLYRYQH